MSIRNTYKKIFLLLIITGIAISNCFSMNNDAKADDKSNQQVIEKTVHKTVIVENQDPNFFWKVVSLWGALSFLGPRHHRHHRWHRPHRRHRRSHYWSRRPYPTPSGIRPYGPYGPYRGRRRRPHRHRRGRRK